MVLVTIRDLFGSLNDKYDDVKSTMDPHLKSLIRNKDFPLNGPNVEFYVTNLITLGKYAPDDIYNTIKNSWNVYKSKK